MLGSNMPIAKRVGFLRCLPQHTLTFITQGQINGWNCLERRRLLFKLLSQRIDGNAVHEILVFPQYSQQKVLGFYVGPAQPRSFITREENHATRFLGVSLKRKFQLSKWVTLVWAFHFLGGQEKTTVMRAIFSRPRATRRKSQFTNQKSQMR